MHTYLTLVVLALMAAHAHSQSKRLCLPKQCEYGVRMTAKYSGAPGQTDIVKQSYDAVGQRIATRGYRPQHFLELILAKQNIALLYNITDNSCEVYNSSDWYDYCVPDDAQELDTYFIGGNQKQYVTDYGNGEQVFGIMVETQPLYRLDIDDDGMTIFQYQNFTLGIKDPDVFNIPDACKKAEWVSDPGYGAVNRRPFSPWLR